jgi:uncharacterized Zn-finger protein
LVLLVEKYFRIKKNFFQDENLEIGSHFSNRQHNRTAQVTKEINENVEISKTTDKNLLKFKNHPKKFQCKICTKKFQTESVLLRHTFIHKKKKKFSCKECNRSYNLRRLYDEHLLTHDDPRPFKCDLCPKTLITKQQISTHIKLIHLKKSGYKCTVCEKNFPTISHLNIHKTVHVTTKNFSCKFCDRKFASEFYVSLHEKRFHGKLKFKVFF